MFRTEFLVDRQLMVVDRKGKMITARRYPVMILIKPEAGPTSFVNNAETCPFIKDDQIRFLFYKCMIMHHCKVFVPVQVTSAGLLTLSHPDKVETVSVDLEEVCGHH